MTSSNSSTESLPSESLSELDVLQMLAERGEQSLRSDVGDGDNSAGGAERRKVRGGCDDDWFGKS